MAAEPMELDTQLPEGPQTLDNPIFASHHSLQSIKDAIEAGFPVTDLQTKPVTVSFVYNPRDILGSVPDRILGMREGPLDEDAARDRQAHMIGERTSLEEMRHRVAVRHDHKGCQMMTHEDQAESTATSSRSMTVAPETKEATLGPHGDMVWWVDPQGNHNLAPAWSQGEQQGTQKPTNVQLPAQLKSPPSENLLDTPDNEDIVSAARETTKKEGNHWLKGPSLQVLSFVSLGSIGPLALLMSMSCIQKLLHLECGWCGDGHLID